MRENSQKLLEETKEWNLWLEREIDKLERKFLVFNIYGVLKVALEQRLKDKNGDLDIVKAFEVYRETKKKEWEEK